MIRGQANSNNGTLRAGWPIVLSRSSIFRTVYYEDQRSLRGELDLMSRYHLRGYAAWRIGDEDPAFWTINKPTTTRRSSAENCGLRNLVIYHCKVKAKPSGAACWACEQPESRNGANGDWLEYLRQRVVAHYQPVLHTRRLSLQSGICEGLGLP